MWWSLSLWPYLIPATEISLLSVVQLVLECDSASSLVGNLFHLFGSDFKPSLPHPVLSSSISLSKVAGSFKCWLKSYLYLGKGAWWKELKGQILESQRFCLPYSGQWNWTKIGIQTWISPCQTSPLFHAASGHRRDRTSLLGKLLCCNASDVLGPEAVPYRTSSSLFYSCFNWLIHWNWSIVGSIAYMILDASLNRVAETYQYFLVLCSKIF